MRFVTGGPDLPADLVKAQEKGTAIFVCGAGVSMTAGLPGFRSLVEGVYEELHERWQDHIAEREGMLDDGRLARQYDRVLRSLERRLAASDLPRHRGMRSRIRQAVHSRLTLPRGAALENHTALLELSRDAEGRSRLLTTNFDPLFERSAFESSGRKIPSHAGPALPPPNVAGFEGVIHLHGRIRDDHAPELALTETDFVLTSAEFGDAYLRSGWASRYIYDIVRTHTVVLVGYEAEDPPMRYLLEALEADRERYPDLKPVYAFAGAAPAEEELVKALWRAKGVEPIIYAVDGISHDALYETIREWRRYADDPSAWRAIRLRSLFAGTPDGNPDNVQECADLLSHGDASSLLGSISPSPEWLPSLANRDVFKPGGARLGEWIVSRLHDPEMIRACTSLTSLDANSLWIIERALDANETTLSAVRIRCWRLILRVARQSRTDAGQAWYSSVERIRSGDTGYEMREVVRVALQPRLKISDARGWVDVLTDTPLPETLSSLIRVHFEPPSTPDGDEIVTAWPRLLTSELSLFATLDHALADALEQASELGYLDGIDRASNDVPSVAVHGQNNYRYGFYPLIRVLTGLWLRIASEDVDSARAAAFGWATSRYGLVKRLHLFAMCSKACFSPAEAFASLIGLDDRSFWLGYGRVEIMKLMTERWVDFSSQEREALEHRIREGLPESLFPADALNDRDRWATIWDAEVFKRLTRLATLGAMLSEPTLKILEEIRGRHPEWTDASDDRQDFTVWSESRTGPTGRPDALVTTADEHLVAEAMRLQRERFFEQGDLWRMLCAADPGRALRGLQNDASRGQWNVAAWQGFFWEAVENDDAELATSIATSIFAMPDEALAQLLSSACHWLGRRSATIEDLEVGGALAFRLWDRLSALAFSDAAPDVGNFDGDVLTRAFGEPAGILTEFLRQRLVAARPAVGEGFVPEIADRLHRAVNAPRAAGLFARVILARSLAFLEAVDPAWVSSQLIPHFTPHRPEAIPLWDALASDRVGSAALFNALEPAMLETFSDPAVSHHTLEGLMVQLLSVTVWHQQRQAPEYLLEAGELRQALRVSVPAVRHTASSQLWQLMGNRVDLPADKATRWRTIIGPVFNDIWPLDGGLRDERIARNLIFMAMECEDAFPEAAQAIVDLVVPLELFDLAHSLGFQPHHSAIAAQYPKTMLRLVSAAIDPDVHRPPPDLSRFLDQCAAADPTVVQEPAYVRLFAIRRLSGA